SIPVRATSSLARAARSSSSDAPARGRTRRSGLRKACAGASASYGSRSRTAGASRAPSASAYRRRSKPKPTGKRHGGPPTPRSIAPRRADATASSHRRTSPPPPPEPGPRPSVLERLVDQVAEQWPVEIPAPGSLRQQDREQRLPRVDPEGRAGDPAPGVLAGRAGRVADPVGEAHRVPETETVAGSQHIAGAGNRSEVVGRHPLAGLASEQPQVAGPATALHQLEESRIVERGGHQPAA